MLALSTLSISSYVTLFTNNPKERAKFKLSRQVPSSIPFVVFDRKYKLQKLLELLLETNLNITEIWCHKLPFITEIVNLIVTSSKEYGIDLNASDDGGWTCLMLACHFSHQEIVKLMMMIENRTKYGINIQQETNDGRTALKIFNDRIEYGE